MNTKIVDSLLADASMCVKLAACGDVDSFAKATALIERARAHLSGPAEPPSPLKKIEQGPYDDVYYDGMKWLDSL